MPITISAPQPGDPFGLGFQVDVSSSFVGPFEPDTFWLFTLTAPANEDIVAQMKIATDSHSFQTGFFYVSDGLMTQVPARAAWKTGQSAQLQVQIVEPSGVLETQTAAVVMDNETGLYNTITAWMAYHPPVVTGAGLTTAEHDAVLQTNVGVIALAGINPLDFVGDLANAFQSNPPLHFGSLSTTYDLVGDGEMPDIGDLLHTKLGIYFVADIPVGLSHRHGQSEEYPARLIQWRTVHSVGGLEMVTEVADFDTHGDLWRWKVSKPSRIEFSVLPGVVVHARWWQFP